MIHLKLVIATIFSSKPETISVIVTTSSITTTASTTVIIASYNFYATSYFICSCNKRCKAQYCHLSLLNTYYDCKKYFLIYFQFKLLIKISLYL